MVGKLMAQGAAGPSSSGERFNEKISARGLVGLAGGGKRPE